MLSFMLLAAYRMSPYLYARWCMFAKVTNSVWSSMSLNQSEVALALLTKHAAQT
jgi:hypothetical protein